ncbi:unnamed protein product [Ophioblennius macclurei]
MANLEHEANEPKHVNMCGESPAAAALSSLLDKPADSVPCSIPSFAAASELLSAPYSCLVMHAHRRHLSLPPVYLKKKRTGIREELETELLRFSHRLNGVPLAYDNVKILGRHGDIFDDSGYIHMDIEANFIVFQPKKGQKLLGQVNKLGVSHVGCLVHGCFNASIPKPNLVTMETWRDFGPRIGAELEFEVTALDADIVGVLLIRGRLNKTRVQEMLAQSESTESSVPVDQTEVDGTNATQEPSEETPEDSPKKKKKKKKKDLIKEEEVDEDVNEPPCEPNGSATPELNAATDETNLGEAAEKKKKKKKKKEEHIKEEEAEEDVNEPPCELNGTTDETNGEETAEKKKKKKKKKEKHIKEEEAEAEISRTEVHGSDSSGYQSDKPSKKRKHETSHDATLDFSEEPEIPKSKKKKRKSETAQIA